MLVDTINTITSNFNKKKKDKKFVERQQQDIQRSIHIEELSDGVSV